MAIYLDNAATSFPKPPQTAEAMTRYLCQVGATINRSTYGAAQEAAMVTISARERLCRLLGYGGHLSHAILTAGCTMSLNQILLGFLHPGDHCLVSAMEHNAVMRPLHQLGIEFDRIPCDSTGLLDPNAIPSMLRRNTKLVLIAHGSNVSGAVQDAEAVGRLCRSHGVAFALDAAQTAGHYPIDFARFGCSALAVPGHKGLMGPSGVGSLLVTPEFAKQLRPVLTGGTGSASHTELQPEFLPDKFESGTPNLPGIYGLEASLAFLEKVTVEAVRRHDLQLMEQFLSGLQTIRNVRLAGPADPAQRVGVFSLDFPGQDNALIGDRLEMEFGILTRCGLHCAPYAHKTLGTFPQGTVRLSFGWFTSPEEVDAALQAIAAISS